MILSTADQARNFVLFVMDHAMDSDDIEAMSADDLREAVVRDVELVFGSLTFSPSKMAEIIDEAIAAWWNR